MQLPKPLCRLPIRFDAHRMLEEVRQFNELDWRPDRFNIDGYWSLNLVSYLGYDNDIQSTPMRPTRHLRRCPYIRQALASLGGPFAEVRLRRLGPNSNVREHYDSNFFFFERLR